MWYSSSNFPFFLSDLGISGIVLNTAGASLLSTTTPFYSSLLSTAGLLPESPSFEKSVERLFTRRIGYEEIVFFGVLVIVMSRKQSFSYSIIRKKIN
jgi:hypothetical protein